MSNNIFSDIVLSDSIRSSYGIISDAKAQADDIIAVAITKATSVEKSANMHRDANLKIVQEIREGLMEVRLVINRLECLQKTWSRAANQLIENNE
jgi:hypothetical protein